MILREASRTSTGEKAMRTSIPMRIHIHIRIQMRVKNKTEKGYDERKISLPAGRPNIYCQG